MLQGKKIIVGITGSIAAYKAAMLVRLLVKEGTEVRVVMTPLAKAFISPLTMATLSQHPVMVDFYNPENGDWNSHVSLGLWADLFLIAPATANTIAKMAHGIADNLLLTTYLSARSPVMISPAMDLDMYQHVATQHNLAILKQRGVDIVEPTVGALASGLEGKGRFEEPEKIVDAVRHRLSMSMSLSGKKVLVTAGPTYEPIDPVRFVGNYASGKMGIALAEEAADRGAEVILVTGANVSYASSPRIKVIQTPTAAEMEKACLDHFPSCDVAVKAAAVADFAPENIENQKIKKNKETRKLTLLLKRTTDILASLGDMKRPDQTLVGFALETEHHRDNALKKIRDKNLDMIVLNDARTEGAGFGTDTNIVTLIFPDETTIALEQKTKRAVAKDIFDNIEKILSLKSLQQ